MKYLVAALLLASNLASAQVSTAVAKMILGDKWATQCSIRKAAPGLDPDSNFLPGELLENTVHSFTDVLEHGGRKTNAGRNQGIASYMAASVISDDRLYNAAYRFYSQLKALDKAAPKILCGIQQTAAYDAFALAKEAAHGDVYLALKVISLFGHDNLQTRLGEPGDLASGDCKVQVLNALRPRVDSNLYCSGALGGGRYKKSDVDRGIEIARQCNDPELTLKEKKLCNDGDLDYQADYYHVLTSAFLTCRRNISEKNSNANVVSTAAVSFAADKAHLLLIKHYKQERFKEDVDDLSSSAEPKDKQLQALLKYALAQISVNKRPLLPSYVEYPTADAHTFKAAKAIAERYEFEMAFRIEQHRMGQKFAKKACESYKPGPAFVAEGNNPKELVSTGPTRKATALDKVSAK